jgi:methyltransferase
MVSQLWYSGFIALLALERGAELALSRRNQRWALEQGGIEFGQAHLLPMKLLHSAFLCGCVLEVWLASRPFLPALGWPCFGLALLCQALRYWVIASLGKRWNIRVIVLPGVPVEVRGPFKFLRHPNYVAVVLEGLAIPLVHCAWLTALVFSTLNLLLLRVRIRCEEAALREHGSYAARLGGRRRFWPSRVSTP